MSAPLLVIDGPSAVRLPCRSPGSPDWVRTPIVEHGRDLGEQLAGALQRRDRVGEVGRGGIVGDRGTSAEWSAKARSKAGRKCSGEISANGGVSNGVCHGFRSGFAGASGGAAFCWASDITNSRFCLEILRQSISRDKAFLGLLSLIVGAISERLRPSTGPFS